LIVLDDVTEDNSIKPYLPPQSSQFKILITTRLKLELANPLYLEVLSEKEALELLSELVSSEKVNQELATAQELCQRLGYLPLALQLVGRYIRKRRISLSEELRRLEGKGLAHASTKVPDYDPTWLIGIERGVAAAFELSWEELTESTQELGCLLSLFALAPIPWSLVESSAVGKNPEELEDSRIKLEKLHLLQVGDNYQLHQLIQEFFRDKQKQLANAEEQKANLCTAIAKIAIEIPQALTLKDVNEFAPFIPHLAGVATFYKNSLIGNNLIAPFIGLGRFYQGQGAYEQALLWYQNSLLFTQKRFGKENVLVATSINNLAGVYDLQGRYEEAEPLYLYALEINKKLLGELHPSVATSLNNLAGLYHSQGRYEEAEPLYLDAVELYKKFLGKSHPTVATILNNLAGLYDSQGRYKEAETFYLDAVELYKELLGASHPTVAISLNNLGLLYCHQGRYEEAEPLYLQALALNKELLGESHPSVATSLNNIAGIYSNQNRYEEAEPLYLQALELNRKLLGESHSSVANSLNNIASLYSNQNRYEEAEPLYLQALELNRKLLGESHPSVASSLNNLAGLYYSQGRYEEAEPFYLESLELYEKTLGKEHPYSINSLNNLALLYFHQSRYEKAKMLYQKRLEDAIQNLGEDHHYSQIIGENFISLLNKLFPTNHFLSREIIEQLLEGVDL